ncbi:FAD-binding domain-containing protein, partial [Aspergillus sp. HF37]
GAASFGMLSLLTVLWFRRWSYEIFIRTHQLLAGLCVYGIWRHLPSGADSPRLYIYIGLGIFGLTSSMQFLTFLYQNGLFAGRGSPRAIVSCDRHEKSSSDTDDGTGIVIKVSLIVPRPVKVKAGQYINLWMPSVSLWSWVQTHPFMVTSWSRGKQDALDLLVQPHSGMTAGLLRQARAIPGSSVSFLAFFTGPHGISADVSHYENALVVASGFGIAAVIPYVKKMIHGYNTCTSQIRRLHLVWQVESI